MSRNSGAFGLFWKNRKQDTVVSDGILTLVVGLLALTLAVVVIVTVMPLADHEASTRIAAGVEAGAARWSALGTLYAANNKGSNRVGVAQAMEPDQVFVRSVAFTGQSSVGYAPAGPCSAPFCTLSLSPTEAEAYARSLVQTGQGLVDEAVVRSVALTGSSAAGYATAGPCSQPLCTLSMGPTEAKAYARSLAQTGQGLADEAFVRSVAVTGQSSVGYTAAGPCSAPFCTLSIGPTEAKAYARSLAQTGQGLADEAFVRSVAVTGQSSVGYTAAGPCSQPFCTLSMGPTEAKAYIQTLAQAGQHSVSLVGGQ
jgi:hypothetical protein